MVMGSVCYLTWTPYSRSKDLVKIEKHHIVRDAL